ncbi:MAG TPA: histidinol dehydrogenase, partial [Spirochaetales bacterium]|nr:histidinol dehydrogenase [Spirochaetales bacterium]
AEALGDYGAGPNHTLPTAQAARYAGGLSVYSFTRVRTWIRMDTKPDSEQLYRDSAALARLEGLYAHARSAESRLSQ